MGKRINHDYIEPLYRAGKLSNCEICRQYEEDHKGQKKWKPTVSESAIRKRAKEKGWEKNLASKVKQQVKENLVRHEVRDLHNSHQVASDQEIIKKAAEVGSGVILRHRSEIKALLAIEDQLLSQIETAQKSYMANYQGQIISQEVELTVKEKSATLKDLADVRAKRIALERQAYNLDEDGAGTSKSFEDYLKELN